MDLINLIGTLQSSAFNKLMRFAESLLTDAGDTLCVVIFYHKFLLKTSKKMRRSLKSRVSEILIFYVILVSITEIFVV